MAESKLCVNLSAVFSGTSFFYQYYTDLHQIGDTRTSWQQCEVKRQTFNQKSHIQSPAESKALNPNTL